MLCGGALGPVSEQAHRAVRISDVLALPRPIGLTRQNREALSHDQFKFRPPAGSPRAKVSGWSPSSGRHRVRPRDSRSQTYRRRTLMRHSQRHWPSPGSGSGATRGDRGRARRRLRRPGPWRAGPGPVRGPRGLGDRAACGRGRRWRSQLNHSHSGSLSGVNLRTLMVSATIFGLLGLGAGLTMRAGAVNLAIGPIMVVSGLYFGAHANKGFYPAAGTRPGDRAHLRSGHRPRRQRVPRPRLGGQPRRRASASRSGSRSCPSRRSLTTRYDAAGQGYYWFGGFALLAVIGGALGAVRPIRRSIGRIRPVDRPGRSPRHARRRHHRPRDRRHRR